MLLLASAAQLVIVKSAVTRLVIVKLEEIRLKDAANVLTETDGHFLSVTEGALLSTGAPDVRPKGSGS